MRRFVLCLLEPAPEVDPVRSKVSSEDTENLKHLILKR